MLSVQAGCSKMVMNLYKAISELVSVVGIGTNTLLIVLIIKRQEYFRTTPKSSLMLSTHSKVHANVFNFSDIVHVLGSL